MKLVRGLMICFLFFALGVNAQTSIGDTIKITTLKYGSTTRDTLISFPTGTLSYEKIIMKYNMRCKDNLVSNQTFPNQGCGEWDYSCNTYIVDSTKVEEAPKTHPNYLISNFTGTVFPYSNNPLFDYYNFTQSTVTINSITSESQYTVGTGSSAAGNILKSDEKSGRTQILVKASELITAGLTAGNIHGVILNVANAGGTVNFLRVKMQLINPTVTALNAASPIITSFTEVHNQNYSFVNGDNRIQFNTPFNWDGTSNVLIDLSFTNTNPSTPIVFNGFTDASNVTLYANNNYALSLEAYGQSTINPTALASIANEISICFWAFGNPKLLPQNTSLLYGWSTNSNDRQLNIHFPWSNSNVYFDAGFVSGYDRINKLATASENAGQWNHWAFTKNATSGDMKIYLNGVLWHSGTGKTKAMSILNLLLGQNQVGTNNYKGKINELSIWDKELALNDIAAWMNKSVDATHPFYANLLAHYKMDEGTGQVINDSKNAAVSNGEN
ncbi:MAG: LamG domain-containing protein, partial [Bacteroidia bacterium]